MLLNMLGHCCLWMVLLGCLGSYMVPCRAFEFRPGEPTESHSCNFVRGIPEELFKPNVSRPSGLNATFYKKYTEAYGIAVLGSSNVTDDALMRACYTVRFLLAGHSGIRYSFYKLGGRVAIMSATEVTLDIPEHSWMAPWWNDRTRSLGGSISLPLNTGAEENLLCYRNDRYWNADILVHETSHGIDFLAARIIIPGFEHRLQTAFNHAKDTGLWNNTYSMTNSGEYFAEAAMAFFNTMKDPGNTSISTNAELKAYDPMLYDLLTEVFPCNNTYLERCHSTREQEQQQVLQMNCNTNHFTFPENLTPADCPDVKIQCLEWARDGKCLKNRAYLLEKCPHSCGVCPPVNSTCTHASKWCPVWAERGECKKNPGYMIPNCSWSCGVCPQE